MSLLSSSSLLDQPALDFAPPEGSGTVHVTSDYTMDAGASLDVIGSPGFKISVKNGQNLTFEMDGTVTVEGGAWQNVTGVLTGDSIHGQGFFKIGATGSLTVSSDLEGAVVAGVRDNVDFAAFDNAGTLQVSSVNGSAFGMVDQGEGGLLNGGTLEVDARDQGVGISYSGNGPISNDSTLTVRAHQAIGVDATDNGGAHLENAGTILAIGAGPDGSAIGGLFFNGVDVFNDGTIEAQARGIAAAVVLHVEDSFINNGALIGISKGVEPSFGLVMDNASHLGNGGLIKGDIALAGVDVYDAYVGGSDPATGDTFDNLRNGRVIGDVMMGGGDDTVINEPGGSINGNVDLGDGDDIFDSSRGVFRHGDVLGGLGNDDITGSRRGDIIFGDEADDSLGGGNDHLRGLKGSDELIGGQGNDILVGGSGADTLNGGSGDDVFVYARTSDSTQALTDVIGDLTSNDVIDLHRIDADPTVSGDQAFHLVGAFSGAPGELVVSFDSASNQTTISGDTNGDGTADLVIVALGDQSGFTNFVL